MSYFRLGAAEVDPVAQAKALAKEAAKDEAHARAKAEADIQTQAQIIARQGLNLVTSNPASSAVVGVAILGLAAGIWYLRKGK